MKIGTQPNLRVLISSSGLDFQTFDPKLPFGQIWAKVGQIKCSNFHEIVQKQILRVLILNSAPDFKNFDPKLPFWGKFVPKNKCSIFHEIGTQPNLR